jgi:excisionase family DNA binding protein
MPTSSNPTNEMLTPSELAGLLKISKAGVYRLIEQRRLPFYKVMGSLRFDKEDVMSFLQQNRIEPVGPIQYGSKKN